MQRGRGTNLLLAACLLLLAGMTAVLSAYPVNDKVVDTETAVKQNELLVSLRTEAQGRLMSETDETGVPMLYITVPEERAAELLPTGEETAPAESGEEPDAQEAEPDSVPAWLTLRGEDPQESFAELVPEDVDDDGCRYSLTLREINRKGRLHNCKLPLLGFDAGARWVLECRGGAGELLPSGEGEAVKAAVHLVINGEDLGRCLVSPSQKETD